MCPGMTKPLASEAPHWAGNIWSHTDSSVPNDYVGWHFGVIKSKDDSVCGISIASFPRHDPLCLHYSKYREAINNLLLARIAELLATDNSFGKVLCSVRGDCDREGDIPLPRSVSLREDEVLCPQSSGRVSSTLKLDFY